MSVSTSWKAKLLLTPREAAEALAVSPRKLWQMTKNGEVPHVKLGWSVRYRPESLSSWLAAQEKRGAQ